MFCVKITITNMASWASKRKLVYGSAATLVVLVLVVLPAFIYFYKPATCADGLKNQNERGVDCGGSCVRLCQSDFLPPLVSWVKFEEVAPELYNVAAYIINKNIEGRASNIPYLMSLYDNRGILIVQEQGSMTIDPHRNSLAFEGSVSVGKRIPAKAVFEFLSAPRWYKARDVLTDLVISDKRYEDHENGSSLEVVIENPTLHEYTDLSVFVVLYDSSGNAIGFSKTFIDRIAPGTKEVAPYTWPINRGGKVATIEVMPIAAPVFTP